MADQADFTLFFKTIADATGITQMGQNIEALASKVQGFGTVLNQALALVGLELTINKLNELGNKALDAREKQANFTEAILRSRDGSQELVARLTDLNAELERTAGVSNSTSQAIEQQLATTRLTGEEIVKLTPAIVNFAAVTGQSAEEVASVLSRRLRGAVDDSDLSLQRLGITAKTTEGIIAQVAAIGGQAGATLAQASGGAKQYDVAVEHLQLSLGNLINLVRVPFMTTLATQTESARAEIDRSSNSFTTLGATIAAYTGEITTFIVQIPARFAVSVATIDAKAHVLVYSVASMVSGTMTTITKAVELAVLTAIDAIQDLVVATSDAVSRLSQGKINIPVDGAIDSLNSLKLKVDDTAKAVVSGLGDPKIKQNLETWTEQSKNLDQIFAKLRASVTLSGDAAKKTYSDFVNLFKNLQAQPGAGVIPAGEGANAEKAAEEALANAKYQLAAAQQVYEAELEKTDALEKSGAISVQQADAQRRTAILQYLAQLDKIKAELPAIIALEQKLGNFKAVDELKLMGLEIDKIHVKEEQALGDTTIFGKIRSQLVQLKNEWTDVGKQIGGFLTQQFQNFASTAGNLIGGLINGTANWKQSILDLASSFVSSLATMVIQWVLARTIISALNKAFGTADAEITGDQAAAAATAWAPAGIAASIASYGAAAGTGLAAFLAAIGIGTAGATAAAGVGGVGFAKGGLTPGVPTPAIVGEEGPEFVVRAAATSFYGVDFLRKLNDRGFAKPASYPRASSSGSSIASGSSGGSAAAGVPAIHLHNNYSPVEAMRIAAAHPEGIHILVDWHNGNTHLLKKP